MGSMIVYYKGDKESKYIPNVELEEYRAQERSFRLGETMFIHYRMNGSDKPRVYVLGEEAVKGIASLSYLYN